MVFGISFFCLLGCVRSVTLQPSSIDTVELEVQSLPESDDLASMFSKMVSVFGIPIVASETVSDAAIIHAGSIMAEYLDNNEDGTEDQAIVSQNMRDRKALLFLFYDEEEMESKADWVILEMHFYAQDLFEVETNPPDAFDASLEEVLHLIQDTDF